MGILSERLGQNDNQNRQREPKKLPLGRAVIAQITNVDVAEDKTRGEARYQFLRVRLRLTVLTKVPEVLTPETYKELRDKGYGYNTFLSFNPVANPGGWRHKKTNAVVAPTALYTFLSKVFYEGGEIPPEDLALDKSPREQAQKVEEFLERLRDKQIFVVFSRPKKVLVASVIGAVPEDELLPPYRQLERPRDPREDDDDPTIVCSVTGQQIRGWEGNTGEWIPNYKWAEMQAEIFGDFLYTAEDGNQYPPPFGPAVYWKAVKQKNSEK